jgi:hypothetical protein
MKSGLGGRRSDPNGRREWKAPAENHTDLGEGPIWPFLLSIMEELFKMSSTRIIHRFDRRQGAKKKTCRQKSLKTNTNARRLLDYKPSPVATAAVALGHGNE